MAQPAPFQEPLGRPNQRGSNFIRSPQVCGLHLVHFSHHSLPLPTFGCFFLYPHPHAVINLQLPSHTVLNQTGWSSAVVLQPLVMPNTRQSSATQYVDSFSSPSRSTLSHVSTLQLSLHDFFGLSVSTQAEQHLHSQDSPRAHNCFYSLTPNSLEGVFAGDDSVVRRHTPGSEGSKYYMLMCSTNLVLVALERGPYLLFVQECLYYLGFHHPDLPVQHTCLRVFVQSPRLTPEAHPPRTNSPVNLVRQLVWGFGDGTLKSVKDVVRPYCCLSAWKTICVAGARRIGLYMVSILLSEMVDQMRRRI